MNIIYIILLVSLIIIGTIILYNMHLSIRKQQNIEHFESKLKSFKRKNKKKDKFGKIANNNNKKKEKFNDLNNKVDIQSVMNRASKLDGDKASLDYIKNEISRYSKSFNKEKFVNTGNPTQDAIAHYKFFKDKFFEIFK